MATIQYFGDGGPDGTVIGKTTSHLIGFYGNTPVVQPSGASQAAVTLGVGAALATTTLSEAATGMWAFSSSTVAQTWRTRINSLRTDVIAVNLLLTKLRANLVTLGVIAGA